VTFRYAGSQLPVLEHLWFEVLTGQTVAIVGTTGSEKSIVVNRISRFYDATCGAVRADDHDVRAVALPSLRARIGIVP
jgi:ATP-binding cassette subfamily B protein